MITYYYYIMLGLAILATLLFLITIILFVKTRNNFYDFLDLKNNRIMAHVEAEKKDLEFQTNSSVETEGATDVTVVVQEDNPKDISIDLPPQTDSTYDDL